MFTPQLSELHLLLITHVWTRKETQNKEHNMLRLGVGAKTVGLGPPPAPALPVLRRRLLRPRGAKKPPGEELPAGGALSKSVLLRSGLALFALGFVDAGYSGEWSRVGAISRDTEELLKLGAYAVVPLCLALIFSASQDSSSG